MNDQTKQNELQVAPLNEIMLDEKGLLQLRTYAEQQRHASQLLQSGMLPKAYDNLAKVLTGVQMLVELRLSPLNGLRNLAIVNGVPSLWGEMPLAMVRHSGLLESINEFTLDKDYNKICYENRNLNAEVFAAICEIKRKGFDKASYSYTALDAAKNPNVNSVVWKSYRAVMMKRRARSMAIKDQFGDVIGGMTIAEYDYDIVPKAGESYTIDHNALPQNEVSKLDKFNSYKKVVAPQYTPLMESDNATEMGVSFDADLIEKDVVDYEQTVVD